MSEPLFNRHAWLSYGRWVQPPLSGVFWTYWQTANSVHEIWADIKCDQLIGLDGHWLGSRADQQKASEFIKHLVQTSTVAQCNQHLEEIGHKYELLHLALLEKPDVVLSDYLGQLFQTYLDVAGVWWFNLFFADVLQQYILDTGNYSETELMNMLEGANRQTWLEQQAMEVRAFAKQLKSAHPSLTAAGISALLIEQDNTLHQQVQKHLAEFEWYGTHHWGGEPYSLKKCVEAIKETFDKGGNDHPAKATITEPLLQLLVTTMYWRTHCAEVTAKVVYGSRAILEQAATNLGLDYTKLTGLSWTEIMESIKLGSSTVSEQQIANREWAYGCYLDTTGKETIIVGSELDKMMAQMLAVVDQNVTELKGMVASKGPTLQGTVTVLISPKDFAQFQKGDILVAPETTPDFVPFMSMASGVITERGGITSHAAIVSRELRIPCIIGTKIATQVLHTGDIVEMNTETGVVSIVQKAKEQ